MQEVKISVVKQPINRHFRTCPWFWTEIRWKRAGI